MFERGLPPAQSFAPATGRRAGTGAPAAAAWCLAHLALWGTAFAVAFEAPRLDGAEQLVWGYALQGGYWKHPPLPSWIMHGLLEAFGPSTALTYVAGQACVALALAIAWRLGSEFMDERRSLAALALSSLIVFYNASADAFNHDLALLPWLAGGAWLFLHAVRSGRWSLWVLTGVAAGFAMLTKYAAAVHFASFALWCVLDRRRRTAANFAGLAVAALTATIVLSPHLAWLLAHDRQPLRYATAVVELHDGTRLAGLARFAGGVGVALLPPALVAWVALRPAVPAARASRGFAPDRSFLWIAGTVPFALTLLIGVAAGANLPVHWATGGLLLTGWLVLDAWPGEMDPARLRRTLIAAAAAHVVLCLGSTAVGPFVAAANHAPGRTNFPSKTLAEAARSTWDKYEPTPLRLIVSDTWIGGNVVAHWKGRPPAVLADGLPVRAAWIPPDAVRRCGALVLLDLSPDAGGDPFVQAGLAAHFERAGPRGAWELPWPGEAAPPRGPVRAWIRWGVIPPQPGATCPL